MEKLKEKNITGIKPVPDMALTVVPPATTEKIGPGKHQRNLDAEGF